MLGERILQSYGWVALIDCFWKNDLIRRTLVIAAILTGFHARRVVHNDRCVVRRVNFGTTSGLWRPEECVKVFLFHRVLHGRLVPAATERRRLPIRPLAGDSHLVAVVCVLQSGIV